MLELSSHNRELEFLLLGDRSLHDPGLDPPRGNVGESKIARWGSSSALVRLLPGKLKLFQTSLWVRLHLEKNPPPPEKNSI